MILKGEWAGKARFLSGPSATSELHGVACLPRMAWFMCSQEAHYGCIMKVQSLRDKGHAGPLLHAARRPLDEVWAAPVSKKPATNGFWNGYPRQHCRCHYPERAGEVLNIQPPPRPKAARRGRTSIAQLSEAQGRM